MVEQYYFRELAERALKVWSADPVALHDAVVALLSEAAQEQNAEVSSQVKAMSRDSLQDRLAVALARPRDFENQPIDRCIETVALYATRIGSIPNTGWHAEVARLQRRYGSRDQNGIRTKSEWHEFLQASLAEKKSPAPDSKITGDGPLGVGLPKRIYAAAELVRSYAAVLAPRGAPDLSRRQKIHKTFQAYSYSPTRKTPTDITPLSN